MRIFGRKRYHARQERRAEQLAEAYQLGLQVGDMRFNDGRQPDPVRGNPDKCAIAAYLLGVNHGYQSAKWVYEDEVDGAIREAAEWGIAEFERLLGETA